jgi:hypothetical protein
MSLWTISLIILVVLVVLLVTSIGNHPYSKQYLTQTLSKAQSDFVLNTTPVSVLHGDRGEGKTVACLNKALKLLIDSPEGTNIIFVSCIPTIAFKAFLGMTQTLDKKIQQRDSSIWFNNKELRFVDGMYLGRDKGFRAPHVIIDDANMLTQKEFHDCFSMCRPSSYSQQVTISIATSLDCPHTTGSFMMNKTNLKRFYL